MTKCSSPYRRIEPAEALSIVKGVTSRNKNWNTDTDGKSRSHFSSIMEAVLGLSYIECRMGSAKSEETGRESVKLA